VELPGNTTLSRRGGGYDVVSLAAHDVNVLWILLGGLLSLRPILASAEFFVASFLLNIHSFIRMAAQ